jgi:hypothetical protein
MSRVRIVIFELKSTSIQKILIIGYQLFKEEVNQLKKYISKLENGKAALFFELAF